MYVNDLFVYCTQAGALENIVKASQLEIIELQHSVEELRYIVVLKIFKLHLILIMFHYWSFELRNIL